MNEIPMVRRGNSLSAVDETSAEAVRDIPADQIVMVVVKARRHPRQHRLAWALAKKVAEACDWLHDTEDAMDWLKVRCRHVKAIQRPGSDEIIFVPKSISFASCDQLKFNRLMKRMTHVVLTEVMPGVTEKKLYDELLAMVDGRNNDRRAA